MTERLLKPDEAADRLSISRTTVYVLIRTGSLRAVDVSPHRTARATWRIPETALTEFINHHTQGAPA